MAAGNVDLGPLFLWCLVTLAIGAAVVGVVVGVVARLVWSAHRRPPDT